jgi:hypothetical protein
MQVGIDFNLSGLPAAIRLVTAHEVSTTSPERVGKCGAVSAVQTHPRGGTDFTIGHLNCDDNV